MDATINNVYESHNQFDSKLSNAERKIASIIFRTPNISQKDILGAVDYTQQYVSKIISNLTSLGIIKVSGKINKGRGQPVSCLEISSEHAYSIGISLMTDSITVVLINMSGVILTEHSYNFTYSTIDGFCFFVEKSLKKILDINGIDLSSIVGVGIGITGFFTGKNRRINPPKQLAILAFADIDLILSEKLGVPVFVDNDGNTAAIAEIMYGIGVTTKSFAYFYISAGLGGGIIINGELYRGIHGNAGEFANIIPNTKSYLTLASLKDGYDAEGIHFATINDLLNKFSIHDKVVDEWIIKGSESLITFVSAIAAILDPETIVFGGRIPTALANKVIKNISIYNSDREGDKKPIPNMVPSQVKGEPTAIGAAILPLMNTFY